MIKPLIIKKISTPNIPVSILVKWQWTNTTANAAMALNNWIPFIIFKYTLNVPISKPSVFNNEFYPFLRIGYQIVKTSRNFYKKCKYYHTENSNYENSGKL